MMGTGEEKEDEEKRNEKRRDEEKEGKRKKMMRIEMKRKETKRRDVKKASQYILVAKWFKETNGFRPRLDHEPEFSSGPENIPAFRDIIRCLLL
jgi:hypothetical protein